MSYQPPTPTGGQPAGQASPPPQYAPQQQQAPPQYAQAQPIYAQPVYAQNPQYVQQPQVYGAVQGGQPMMVQGQYPQTTQTIVVQSPSSCPAGGPHYIIEEFNPCGILCAICFFPIGILCCLAMRDQRCTKCGTRFG